MDGDGVAATDAAGVALAAADGLVLGDGAGAMTVNLGGSPGEVAVLGRTVVQRTWYVPASSGGSASVIFLASAASTWPPDAIWAPLAFRTTIELLDGSSASVNVATISVGVAATVEPFAGRDRVELGVAEDAAGAARATMNATTASRLTDRPRPARESGGSWPRVYEQPRSPAAGRTARNRDRPGPRGRRRSRSIRPGQESDGGVPLGQAASVRGAALLAVVAARSGNREADVDQPVTKPDPGRRRGRRPGRRQRPGRLVWSRARARSARRAGGRPRGGGP